MHYIQNTIQYKWNSNRIAAMIISTMKVNADRLIDTTLFSFLCILHCDTFKKKTENGIKSQRNAPKKLSVFIFIVSTNYGYSIYLAGIIENDFWINWYSLRHFLLLLLLPLLLFVSMWMCLMHSVTAPQNPHVSLRRKNHQRMKMCKQQRKSEWFVCSKLSFISTLQFSIGMANGR